MKKTYIWEDPYTFEINKEDGHTLAMPYDDEKSTIDGSSPYKYSLNGTWKFLWETGVTRPHEGFEKTDFDDSEWDDIPVPSVWQLKGYGAPFYYASSYPRALSRSKNKIPSIDHDMQEVGFYRKAFTLPDSFEGREVFLHFGACKAALEVWLNGEYVGYSCGSMTPHEFDVTRFLTAGENTLCAKVYRYAASSYLEDQDMWWMSGIYREVYLYAEPKVCLRDFYIQTDLDAEYKNASLKIDYYLKNYADKDGDVAVKAYLLSPTGKEIPLSETCGTVKAGETLALSVEDLIKNPKKWSAEQPHLYTLVMVLNYDGKPCVKSYPVGFKKVEIVGEKILFNGMPLLLCGTNRHDFDPDNGWAVPRERYVQDFDLMKQCNINAIRCSHYPDDPYFYELANTYGFYVMDECDLESHGVRRKNVPGDNPMWTGLAVDKMERMVLRDRNNPCIFMWSLGNEAGDGTNFMKMKEAALKLDATRPFHYEGDFDFTKSDVISRMYPDEKTMEMLGTKTPITISLYDNIANMLAADSKPIAAEMYHKPVLLCEYAHSMENSLGNFQEYMDDFEKYDNMCGGFIWDWVDQAIRKVNDDGSENWLYGIDFEKAEPKKRGKGFDKTAMTGSNRYFCANGVIGADRAPHPQFDEVRHVYQPIVTTVSDVTSGRFKVRSRFLFSDLASYKCKWKIDCEGVEWQAGELDKFNLLPLQEEIIEIPYDYASLPEGKECVLTISFHTRKKTPGLKSNYELAFDQFILTKSVKPVMKRSDKKLTVTQTGNRVTVTGNAFSAVVDNARLTEYKTDGDNLLAAPAAPEYFRALTDNDRDVFNFAPPLMHLNTYYQWEKSAASVKAIKTEVEACDGLVKIRVAMTAAHLADAFVSYTVFADGRIAVYHSAVPKLDPLRFGFTFGVDGDMDAVQWYGRGPAPCYPDRKTGSKIGLYSMNAAQLDYRYMRPQESSSRADVRYFTLTDKKGWGLKVTAYYDKPVLFSVLPYTPYQLEGYEHIGDMKKNEQLTVIVDAAQQGVGGDMPGQACVRDKYKLKKGEKLTLSFLLEFLR